MCILASPGQADVAHTIIYVIVNIDQNAQQDQCVYKKLCSYVFSNWMK